MLIFPVYAFIWYKLPVPAILSISYSVAGFLYFVLHTVYIRITKTGYTHVLIPESLHSVLKEKAKGQNTSISRYIQSLIDRAESPAWKACGALPLGSSNLPLGALL